MSRTFSTPCLQTGEEINTASCLGPYTGTRDDTCQRPCKMTTYCLNCEECILLDNRNLKLLLFSLLNIEVMMWMGEEY